MENKRTTAIELDELVSIDGSEFNTDIEEATAESENFSTQEVTAEDSSGATCIIEVGSTKGMSTHGPTGERMTFDTDDGNYYIVEIISDTELKVERK